MFEFGIDSRFIGYAQYTFCAKFSYWMIYIAWKGYWWHNNTQTTAKCSIIYAFLDFWLLYWPRDIKRYFFLFVSVVHECLNCSKSTATRKTMDTVPGYKEKSCISYILLAWIECVHFIVHSLFTSNSRIDEPK